MTESDDEHERVTFEEPWPDMPDTLEPLVGDTGIVKPASKAIPNEINGTDSVCVAFGTDKTGRAAGDDYWIPVDRLSRVSDTETIQLEVTPAVAEQIRAAARLSGVTVDRFMEDAVLGRLQALDNVLHDETEIDLPDDFDVEAWRERYEKIRRLDTDYGG